MFISANVIGQSTIAAWTFTDVITPSSGDGKLSLLGVSISGYNTGFSGSPDKGLTTNNYPALGTNSKKSGLNFSISTLNLQDLNFTYQLRHSSTSANTEVVQYSTDSVNFVDKEIFTITPSGSTGDVWYSRTVDFSTITDLNNKSKIFIRVVSGFDATSGNYLATKTGSTYSSNGTWRFDNVIFTANSLASSKINYSIMFSKKSSNESDAEQIKIKVIAASTPSVDQKIGLSFAGDASSADYDLALNFDSLVIKAGNTSDSTYITIKNDSEIENNEKLIVKSSSLLFGLNGKIIDSLTIIDDEAILANPKLTLSLSKKNVEEKSVAPYDTVFYKIRPQGNLYFQANQSLSINIKGNNITSDDYLLNANTVNLSTTDSIATGYITVKDDNLEETIEKLIVEFTLNGLNTVLISDSFNIADNDLVLTKISTIQGKGKTATLIGSTLNIKGIVTGVFAGKGGYYVQESENDYDNDSLTSEGIYVIKANPTVKVGDVVAIKGVISESFNLTAITPTTATVIASNQTLPSVKNITLPLLHDSLWESYESMLIRFPQTLSVSEVYNLGRYGEVTLSQGGRLKNPTNILDPNDADRNNTTYEGISNVSVITNENAAQLRRKILLEDNNDAQNPDPTPYLNPADTTLRCGSTINNVTGILSYGFNLFRILPTQNPVINYSLRPTPPVNNQTNNIKIASFNVLNFFNGDGKGAGFPTARGANTLAEFNVQKAKLIKAITAINADVAGLMEMENDGDDQYSAIQELVNSLNAATSPGTYTFVKDPTGANGNTGTDAIKVSIIYKPSKVTPTNNSLASTEAIFDRPPLAQTFTLNENQAKFTVITNHFKSKSTSTAPSGLDIDQNDGQGAYNNRRLQQSVELAKFVDNIIQTTGDSDVVLLGDFNAYNQEDPIDYFRSKGYINSLEGDEVYSYVFNGQTGSLDHAIYTPTLASQFSNAAKWHINADEPIVLDYNVEFKSVNQNKLNQTTAFRCSDHDPVIAWFNLQAPKLTGIESNNNAEKITISPNPSDNFIHINSIEEILSAEITTILGEKVIAKINHNTIDTSKLVSGIYFLTIQTNSGAQTIKFIKK